MGPNWWLKTQLEQIYLGGLRNLDLGLIVRRTALPVIAILGTCLALPYIAAMSIAPLIAPTSALVSIKMPEKFSEFFYITFCRKINLFYLFCLKEN